MILIHKYKPQNTYYDIPLSRELQKFTYDTCKKYKINYELALSVMYVESNFDIKSVSYNRDNYGDILSRDRGLFQINNIYEDWFAELAGLQKYNVFNPYDNIQMGIAGLSYYKNRWNYIKDKNKLRIHLLNSYNLGEQGFKRYMKYTGKISRSYDRKILNYKENLLIIKIILY